MYKNKNAPISRIKAFRVRILWCDTKLLLWRMYSALHFVLIPICFAAVFGRLAPFFLPVILFACSVELRLIGDTSHPINVKIEKIKKARNDFRTRINGC